MPRLTTPNSLYKFITAKLCHPMRICLESRILWPVANWYGYPFSNHTYCIELRAEDARIRYEDDYWNEEVIIKWKGSLIQ